MSSLFTASQVIFHTFLVNDDIFPSWPVYIFVHVKTRVNGVPLFIVNGHTEVRFQPQ